MKKNIIKTMAAIFTSFFLLSVSQLTQAALISAIVQDHSGQPVEDAVVSLIPLDGSAIPAPGNKLSNMRQKDRAFIPHVLAIQKGTRVAFPNQDNILHHVYSFAPIKRFEISLYSGTPADPVMFDKAGIVPLGCNIHDWMLGYIVITDTPYFSKSDATGKLNIKDIPAGKYHGTLWHPRLKGGSKQHDQIVEIKTDINKQLEFNVSLKRKRRREPPDDFEKSYY